MRIAFSHEADDDLLSVALFIADDSPARATNFVDALVGACMGLTRYPLRYPVVAGYRRPLRRFPFRGYSIYYVLDDEGIVIVHILHDALDHARVLSGEDGGD